MCLAHDELLQRDVAIKWAGTGDSGARMRAEARILAGLSHPGIVAVHDVLDGPHACIVLEYIGGRNLEALLAEPGKIAPRRALAIVLAAADALGAAHTAGVAHCDLKPANIIIDDATDAVRLVDFGVARCRERRPSRHGFSDAWAAPEQLDGGIADARSDVYSLALILRTLWRSGETHVGPGPRYRAIETVIQRSLAIDPAMRYGDANAFATALRDAMSDLTEIRQLAPRSDIRPRIAKALTLLPVLVLLVVLLVGLGFAHLGSSAPPLVTVPALTGLPAPRAQSISRSLGLRPMIRRLYSTRAPANAVLSQVPGSGKQARIGTRLLLEVSRGLRPVVMPDAVGHQLATAEILLRHRGLRYTVHTVQSLTATGGRVAAQSVPAGRRIPAHATIQLTVTQKPGWWQFITHLLSI